MVSEIQNGEILYPDAFEALLGLLSTRDLASVRRVCRYWNECAKELVYKRKCQEEIPHCHPSKRPHCGWEACWRAWTSFREHVANGDRLVPEELYRLVPEGHGGTYPQDLGLVQFLKHHRLLAVFCQYQVVGREVVEGKPSSTIAMYNMETKKVTARTFPGSLGPGFQTVFPCAEGFFIATTDQKIFLCDVMMGRFTHVHTLDPEVISPTRIKHRPLAQIIANRRYICVLGGADSHVDVILRKEGSCRIFRPSQAPALCRMEWGPREDLLILFHRSGHCSTHLFEMNLSTGEQRDLFCARQSPHCAITDMLSSNTTLFVAVEGEVVTIPYSSEPPYSVGFDPTPSSGDMSILLSDTSEVVFFERRSSLRSMGNPRYLFSDPEEALVGNPYSPLTRVVNGEGRVLYRTLLDCVSTVGPPLIPLINGTVLAGSNQVEVCRWVAAPLRGEEEREAPIRAKRLPIPPSLQSLVECYNSAPTRGEPPPTRPLEEELCSVQ